MKRFVVAILAALAAAVTALTPGNAPAAVGLCDPQHSQLCRALVEVWNFEESSDYVRRGDFLDTPLYEPSGVNIATATGKVGSYSADFTGTKQFTLPRAGSIIPGAGYTVAAWVYLTSTSGYQDILDTTVGTPDYEGVILRLNAGKPEINEREQETNNLFTKTYSTAISTNAWHLVVFMVSPYGPYGKAQGCISVDNGTVECGSLSYNMKGSVGDLTVGGRGTDYLNGRIDGLLIAHRVWTPSDVALYWNSGSGRAFPFY